MTDIKKLRELLAKGTQGEWHHVQAFQSVPAQKTIHGTVPGQRVDYVSTWPGPGTPKGHRVIVPMETLTDSGVARTVSSNDMALITAAVNALPALLDEVERMREALETISERHVPDQPAADGSEEADYVRKHHSELRRIARAALGETK